MARASYFSGIFWNSPVTPLQKHIDSVVACVEMLPPCFDAVFADNGDEAARIQGQIAQLEHVSDGIKNELRVTGSIIYVMDHYSAGRGTTGDRVFLYYCCNLPGKS